MTQSEELHYTCTYRPLANGGMYCIGCGNVIYQTTRSALIAAAKDDLGYDPTANCTKLDCHSTHPHG